ncbi:MAG: alkaline phosphatase D family protein [Actinomycetota bacterium]
MPIDRRVFLAGSAAVVGAGALWGISSTGQIRRGRPEITHGVQSGDVGAGAAVVWARADRASRMFVEFDTTPAFRSGQSVEGPTVTDATDLTGKLVLSDLPAGQDVFYRVTFADTDDSSLVSEPAVGRLRTAPTDRSDINFVWSADTAGQGWGIDESRGGMRAYSTMRELEPDFFVHSGDTIYADNPLEAEVPLDDGTVWRNLVTPEKAKVAETLAEYWGNFRYNLLDDNVRAFNADVPVIAQWDDHETVNNWWPGQILDDPRYTVTDVNVLAERARTAFHDYFPTMGTARDPQRIYRKISYGPSLDLFVLDLRSYRGPNSTNDQPTPSTDTAILGAEQLRWLAAELAASTATWKVICSDMPLGLTVGSGADIDAVAQGRPQALGREFEFVNLLSSMRANGVQNVVVITGDVHYTAAHRYEPGRAVVTDFTPFWEFVAGPIHAGTFGPNELDPTFGPEVRFQKAADYPNQPPSDGNQFFGHVSIDGRTEAMSVRLIDANGSVLHTEELAPAPEAA